MICIWILGQRTWRIYFNYFSALIVIFPTFYRSLLQKQLLPATVSFFSKHLLFSVCKIKTSHSSPHWYRNAAIEHMSIDNIFLCANTIVKTCYSSMQYLSRFLLSPSTLLWFLDDQSKIFCLGAVSWTAVDACFSYSVGLFLTCPYLDHTDCGPKNRKWKRLRLTVNSKFEMYLAGRWWENGTTLSSLFHPNHPLPTRCS